MKTTPKYILALCVLAIGFSAPVIRAEDTPEAPKKEQGSKGDSGKVMKEKLGLTDTQVEQMKKIRSDERAQMEKLRNDQSISKEDKLAARKKIHDETKAKVDAILTPEQRKKAEEMRNARGEKAPKDGQKPKKSAGDDVQ